MLRLANWLFLNWLCVSSIFSQQLIEYQDTANIEHTFLHETFIGGGAAFFDYDNDGDDDLYLTSGNWIDLFYENNGDGTFTDKTIEAGFSLTNRYNTMGVIVGDIDNDGHKDLFVTTKQKIGQSFDRNLLFLNQGDGTFKEIWPENSNAQNSWSISATFLDYDLDGLLDIYVGNYVEESKIIRGENNEITRYDHKCFKNHFYKNLGTGNFIEISKTLNLDDAGCALAVTASDFDNDGDLDLVLANDFGPYILPNRFFINDRENNQFVEIGTAINASQAIYGMGIAVGDYDNDLDLDYYITNNGNNLLLQNNDGVFTESAQNAGVDNTWNVKDIALAVGWGCAFLDIDNDSDLDLYVANGYVPGPDFLPTHINDYDKIFLNNGGATFQEDTINYFIDNPYVSRGMAFSDIDKDGDLDILSVVQKAPLNATRNSKLFLNQTSNNKNWLQLQLTGVTVNRDAYGSKAYVFAEGKAYMQELNGGSSHCSQSTSILHFGLDDIEILDSLKVIWTGGLKTQTFYNIPVNQRILIKENQTDFITDIHSVQQKNEVKLFPNPMYNHFFLDLSLLEIHTPLFVDIFSIDGERVYSRKIAKFTANALKINTSTFTSGMYILRISSQQAAIVKKVIKH